ncbi:Mini-ribonuclease 3 [Haloimpatiens lingqiaonensis]|uniref:Mini-ribonuclease 3 n=1 Tax=Haloimpatiens lingqiaonensis TaxID=1380675 RepID=UPI0010FE2BBE|nr:Mini-ribonuclease 3 [Haloimpatiens lingqiaonensis]
MEIDILNKKLSEVDIRGLNPLVLAFIGDAVYEVFVRTNLVENNKDMSAHKLHVKAVSFVKAKAQSEIIKGIMDSLTDEEIVIFKRGRNSKSGTVPKNADVQDYRMATGFEALIGYLYLMERKDRLNEIMNFIFKHSN